MAQAVQTQTDPIDWNKYFWWAVSLLIAIMFLLWVRDATAGMRPARLMNASIQGLLSGGIYALVALGIVIINKASGVFNFAHGQMLLFGGFVFYSFFAVADINVYAAFGIAAATSLAAITMSNWRDALIPRNLAYAAAGTVVLTVLMTAGGPDLKFVRAVVGGVTASVLMGLVIERLTIRPLIGQPLFTIVLMTLAVDRLLAGMIQLLWGSVDRPLTIFTGLRDLGIKDIYRISASDTFLNGEIRISSNLLTAFLLALVAFGIFVLFFRYTNIGLAMRATSENQQLAQALGLRVRVILGVAWALAGVLAMIAGILQAGATNLSNILPGLALRAFPAVLLGGLESVGGAVIGGLVIGLAQELANLLYPSTQAGTELAPYAVLMVVLIIRPDGLFGQKRIERI